MRKTVIAAVLILALCFSFVCACTSGEDLTVEALEGKWVQYLDDGTEMITFSSNMTYNKVINLTGNVPVSSATSDSYKIEGDKLIIHNTNFNTDSEYTVTISGNSMTWDNGTAKVKFTKVS